jgi:poly(3-hydroxybutyrate) depolymerase
MLHQAFLNTVRHGQSEMAVNQSDARPHLRQCQRIVHSLPTLANSTLVRLGIDVDISHPHTDTTLKESICSASNNDAVVSGFTVKGLGHAWPSTLGLDGDVTDFNATTADILPFFETHTLM